MGTPIMETQKWDSNSQYPSWFPNAGTPVDSEYLSGLPQEIDGLLRKAKNYRTEALEQLHRSSQSSVETVYRLRERQPKSISKSYRKSRLFKQKTESSSMPQKPVAEQKRNGTEMERKPRAKTPEFDSLHSASFNNMPGEQAGSVLPNCSSSQPNLSIPDIGKSSEMFYNLMCTTNEINRRISKGFNTSPPNNFYSQLKSIIPKVCSKMEENKHIVSKPDKRSHTYMNSYSTSKKRTVFRERLFRKLKRTNRRSSKTNWQNYLVRLNHCTSLETKLKMLENERKIARMLETKRKMANDELFLSKGIEFNKLILKSKLPNNCTNLQNNPSSEKKSDTSKNEKEHKKLDLVYDRELNRYRYKNNWQIYFNRLLVKYSPPGKNSVHKTDKKMENPSKTVSKIKDGDERILTIKPNIVNIGKCLNTSPGIRSVKARMYKSNSETFLRGLPQNACTNNETSLPNIEAQPKRVPKLRENHPHSDKLVRPRSSILNTKNIENDKHSVQTVKMMPEIAPRPISAVYGNRVPKVDSFSSAKSDIINNEIKTENNDSLQKTTSMPQLISRPSSAASTRPKEGILNFEDIAEKKENYIYEISLMQNYPQTYYPIPLKDGRYVRPKSCALNVSKMSDKNENSIEATGLNLKLNSMTNAETLCNILPDNVTTSSKPTNSSTGEILAKKDDSTQTNKPISEKKKYLEIFRTILSEDYFAEGDGSSEKNIDSEHGSKQKSVCINTEKTKETTEDSKQKTKMMQNYDFRRKSDRCHNAERKCHYSTKQTINRSNYRSNSETFCGRISQTSCTKLKSSFSNTEERAESSEMSVQENKSVLKPTGKNTTGIRRNISSDKTLKSRIRHTEETLKQKDPIGDSELIEHVNYSNSTEIDCNNLFDECYSAKPISNPFNTDRKPSIRKVLIPKNTLMDRNVFDWNAGSNDKGSSGKNLFVTKVIQNMEGNCERNRSNNGEFKSRIKTNEKHQAKTLDLIPRVNNGNESQLTSTSQTEFVSLVKSYPINHPGISQRSCIVDYGVRTKRTRAFDYVYSRATNNRHQPKKKGTHRIWSLNTSKNIPQKEQLSVGSVPLSGRCLLSSQYFRAIHPN